ncbi:hypothetical protein GCM10023175_65020 [Pseudonocardia xishanensis]|uniref:HTH-type transcriptional repressor KstR2 C-terminal domain-containing protein n=1 Tax=Pseudonocardia xishanensis TaxID=630995 RepID=A0ABP8S3H2_9PSEU
MGLSKGTILDHFASKEALLGEVHVAYFTRRFNEADFVHAEPDDPVARLVAMIYALLAAHRDDRAASLACLRELVRYSDGALTDYVREQRVRYTRIVVDILRDGIGSGRFRSGGPKMTALHIFGMCNHAWTWYRPEGEKSVEDIAGQFDRDILVGLLPSPDVDVSLDKVVGLAVDTVSGPRDVLRLRPSSHNGSSSRSRSLTAGTVRPSDSGSRHHRVPTRSDVPPRP